MTPYDFLIRDLGRLPRQMLLRSAVCTGISLGVVGWTGGEDGPNSSLYSSRLEVMKQGMPPGPPAAAARVNTNAPATPLGWYVVPPPPVNENTLNDIPTIP